MVRRCCCFRAMSSSVDDLRSGYFWLGLFSEALGTFILVLIGCGTCLGGVGADSESASPSSWEKSEPTKVQISLAFGLAVATAVWSLAHVSGGHVNPAVTVAMLCARRISVVRALLYVFAQCAGAASGAVALAGLTPPGLRGGLGLTTVDSELTKQQAFGIEATITFVLVLTVFACCDSQRTDLNGSAPLTIGLSVTLCHLFAIKYTGSSMNPARTFGPAVVTGIWEDHWVYWAGPIIGGILAGLLYELLLASDASVAKARRFLLSIDSQATDGRTAARGGLLPVDAANDVEMQLSASGSSSPPPSPSVTDEKQRLKVVEVEVSV